jgi:hypothetical protein
MIITHNNNMPVSRNLTKQAASLINQPGANGDVISAVAKTDCQLCLRHSHITYCFAR